MIPPNLVCETYYTFSAKHLRDVPNFMLGASSSYLKGSVYIRCSRCASDMWNCFNIACTIHSVKFSSWNQPYMHQNIYTTGAQNL